MSSSSALQELSHLINQSNQELEALAKTYQETQSIDVLITTQVMRTLHTIKGLANMCGLSQAGTITHLLETIIDGLAKQKFTVNEQILTSLTESNTLLYSILQHGEQQLQQTIDKTITTLQALSTGQKLDTVREEVPPEDPPEFVEGLVEGHSATKSNPYERVKTQTNQQEPKQQEPAKKTDSIDYQALGLELDDIMQLSETERLMIDQTFNKKRPVVGYLIHLDIKQLEQNIQKIEQVIKENGTVITTIPTHSKLPQFHYAFVCIFTTALDPKILHTKLTLPGTLIWMIKDAPLEKITIGNKQAPIVQQVPQKEVTQQASPTLKHVAQQEKLPTQEVPKKQENPQQKEQETQAKKKQTTHVSTSGPTKIDFDQIEQNWKQKTDDPVLHIPLSKIDTLIDHTNKLISCKTKLEKFIKRIKPNDKQWEHIITLEEHIGTLDKYLKLLQQAILNARLVKTETILDDLTRLVKSIAQEGGKKVDFQLIGKNVEIDKGILDGLQQPLIHLIKNAVDHGIKTPEERKEVEKSPEGHITISFQATGSSVRVSIQDDGQGIDAQAIKKKALEKGLIDPIKAANFSDKEIYQFIFIPGFSTKQVVTQTSGRGVGMDAVKNAIDKMHGELIFESQAGQGTTFTIAIPSYLSIQRLLRFTLDDHHYALPFATITEVIPYEETLIHDGQNQKVCIWQGKTIPVLALADIIEAKKDLPKKEHQNIVIITHRKKNIALIVDTILGQEEIIVRPIQANIQKELELFAGHADFGDDNLVLIINIDKLWERISHE